MQPKTDQKPKYFSKNDIPRAGKEFANWVRFELRFSCAGVLFKGASSFWRQKGVDNHVLGTSEVLGDFSENLNHEGIVVHHLPIENSLRFYKKFFGFLWAEDVFVMPSIYEGFGIVALEAYACNLPVVLARSPGLDFWGAYFPETVYIETTADSLAKGETIVLEDSNNYKNHNQTLLFNNFGIQNCAKKYLSLFLGNYAN